MSPASFLLQLCLAAGVLGQESGEGGGHGGALLTPDAPWEGRLERGGGTTVSTAALEEGGYTSTATVVGLGVPLRVPRAGRYHVDLRSSTFDAYLVVRDGAGDVLAEDDDGGLGTHARVELELPAGDEVTVWACALHGGRGAFSLTVTEGPAPVLSAAELLAAEIADGELRLDSLRAADDADPLREAELLEGLSNLLTRQGDLAAATERLTRALVLLEGALPAGHERIAVTLFRLGGLQREAARHADALASFRRARALFVDWYGPEHLNVAGCLNDEALTLQMAGRHAEALPLLEQALAIYESVLGPEHLFTTTLAGNIGQLLQERGEPGRALPLLERSLRGAEQARGVDSLPAAMARNDLATVLLDLGRWEEALAGFRRAHAVIVEQVGDGHPMVASGLNNQALTLGRLGRLDEALELLPRAIALRAATLGAEHPEVGRALGNLGSLLREDGRNEEARQVLEQALAVLGASLGPAHPDVAVVRNNLALVRLSEGDRSAARQLLDDAERQLEALYGRDDPDLAVSLGNHAALLADLGDVDGALTRLERALALRREHLGPQHPDTLRLERQRVTLWLRQGRPQQAVELGRESLGRHRAILPGDHPAVARSALQLATALLQVDAAGEAADEAVDLLEACLATLREELGPGHVALVTPLMRLAEARLRVDDPAGALPGLEQAVAIVEDGLGAAHPQLLGPLQVLVSTLVALGRHDEAARQARRALTVLRAELDRSLPGLSEGEMHLALAREREALELLASPLFTGDGPAAVVAAYEDHLAFKGLALRTAAGRVRRAAGQVDERTARRVRRLREVQALLSAELFRPEAETQDGLADLLDEHSRLERALAVGAEARDAASFGELSRSLPPDAALIDLYVRRQLEPQPGVSTWALGAERVVAWVTRPGAAAPVRVDLGASAELEELLVATLSRAGVPLRGRSPRAAPAPGRALTERLWEPLAEHVGDARRLFIAPDGALADLPWEVLRDGEGGFLLERMACVYLTDPGRLVELVARGPRSVEGELLAVGAVDYDASPAPLDDDAGAGDPPADERTRGALEAPRPGVPVDGPWDALPGTADELDRVVARHARHVGRAGRTVLRGDRAGEAQLVERLPGATVLHVATHGFSRADERFVSSDLSIAAPDGTLAGDLQARRLDARHPALLSALVCAGANRGGAGPDDGYLTAEELGWVDLSGCALAVLSACESGLGRAHPGEGLLGLRRSLVLAGADSVVASLWAVGDRATAELMDRFYRNLWERGLPRHDALRAAQLERLAEDRAAGGDGDPASWGAFVLYGDWR